MARWSRIIQPLSCIMGKHMEPPPRDPTGPIVTICPCCGRAFYSHGMTIDGNAQIPNLLLANFPPMDMRPSLESKEPPKALTE